MKNALVKFIVSVLGYCLRGLIIALILNSDVALIEQLKVFFGIQNLSFLQYFGGSLLLMYLLSMLSPTLLDKYCNRKDE
jgi:hypothetical protein